MDLTGKILIAMPAMGDPRFARAVVLMCSHSAEGAMGLIVNHPVHDLALGDLLAQLEIVPSVALPPAVHLGGPVERGRGFVLHSPDYCAAGATLPIGPGFAMTATVEVLEALAAGRGPVQALVMLGYAGWGPGQLESEIAQNAWLTGDPDPALIFATPAAALWEAALATLGISPLLLSETPGRA